MRVLLFAMPDMVDVIDAFSRMPNLAIVNIAGSLVGHETKVLDLVLHKPAIRQPIIEAMETFRPRIVGLSAMTFQFSTLLRVARFLRARYPGVLLAAGGYHASLLSTELTEAGEPLPLDFLIRGEGEITFRELVDALESGKQALCDIAGLSFREGERWVHNRDRELCDLARLPLPMRDARILGGFHMFGEPLDVAETSRGCRFNCKFCSITQVYGKSHRTFPMDRLVKDLSAIRTRGARIVFFSDDNITLDADHFRQVCTAIIDNNLNDLSYLIQVSAAGIAQNPDLVELMARANFRIAFVGFESMDTGSLKSVAKPTSPAMNERAAALLKSHAIAVIAGIVVGYPEDDADAIRRNFALLRRLRPDGIYAQYLTPYPKTLIRQELLDAGLVTNVGNFRWYDGFHCNVRTLHLSEHELYRCLRRELFKSYFHIPLIISNSFIRRFGGRYLRFILKTLGIRVYNLILGRERVYGLDL